MTRSRIASDSVRMCFVFPRSLRAELKAISAETGVPVAEIVRAGSQVAVREVRKTGRLPRK